MAAAPNSTARKSRGPPIKYSDSVAAVICARMAEGETLKSICQDSHMPNRSTVYLWTSKNPQFSDMYARARESLHEHWADEILTIADDGTTDYVTKVGRNGHEYEAVDQEHIQRSRLRVDSRRWLLSKLKPGVYGDRIESVVSGQIDVVHSLSDRERMRRMALFLLEDEAADGVVIEGQAIEVQPAIEQAPSPAKP